MLRELFRRRQTAENLRPRNYDVVVVLGGNIRLHPDGRYSSTTWEDGPEKSIGSFWRGNAAAELVRQGRTHHLIFSTGKTHSKPTSPGEAVVLNEDFSRAILNYPDYERFSYEVAVDNDSVNTMQNARNVARMLKDKKYKHAKTIGILSSSYHLPRAHLMFSEEFKRQGLDKKIVLISTERVLIEAEQKQGQTRYLQESRDAYHTERLRRQIREQHQGMRDFRAENYNFSIPPG